MDRATRPQTPRRQLSVSIEGQNPRPMADADVIGSATIATCSMPCSSSRLDFNASSVYRRAPLSGRMLPSLRASAVAQFLQVLKSV
jgi:hypothetical protein